MKSEDGFSIIELMITLFIAALFLLTGYQLFSVAIARSGESREMSEASNIGYETLRLSENERVAPVTNDCNAPQITQVNRQISSLPNATIVVKRCKPFNDAGLTQMSVVVTYGNPKKEVIHASYIPQ